jgi:hypothetical protein
MGAAWCRDRRKGGKILFAVGISPALKRRMVAHKARTRISMAEQVEAALLAYLPPPEPVVRPAGPVREGAASEYRVVGHQRYRIQRGPQGGAAGGNGAWTGERPHNPP